MTITAAQDFTGFINGRRFKTILADPPWQFQNRTGKMAPEHKRLARYSTMTLDDIKALPVSDAVESTSHLYLWVPNALLPEGLAVMQAWGFNYKSNIVWQKVRKDGGPDGRGVGFYFRNVTEILLFGVRGKNARTLQPGRTQVNIISTRKREHSRKPDEQYEVIQSCSPGPYLELFARGERPKWTIWGHQADESYVPTWPTYGNHSRRHIDQSQDLFVTSSSASTAAASNRIIDAGRPINTSGQGLPTPRCTRSISLSQWVVA
jgi:N6-adenosine-specific RNA methylase IME4